MNFTGIFDPQLPLGYVPGLSFDAYGMAPGVNNSLLKEQTPFEMWHELQVPAVVKQEELSESRATAYAKGEAIHKAILEPDRFENYFQMSPTKGLTTEKAKAAMAADPSRPLVNAEIIDIARAVRDAVYAHHFAKRLLGAKGAQREVSGFAWDEEFQLRRKIRVDFLPAKGSSFILDLKSCHGGLSIGEFANVARKLGYGTQAAYYLDTHGMITGENRTQFLIIAARTEKPYMARVFQLDELIAVDNLLREGRARYRMRLQMFSAAAQEFILRAKENHPDPAAAWEGYENEEPQLLIPRKGWADDDDKPQT